MLQIMESQNNNTPKFRPNPGLKLMDQVREVLRYYHYAYRTEQTYGRWILRYLHYFGGKTHPNRLGAQDVERFLSHLATEGQVSASTQRQALNALIFLYRDVLDKPLVTEITPVRSERLRSPLDHLLGLPRVPGQPRGFFLTSALCEPPSLMNS